VKQVAVIWRLNGMIPTLRPIAWSLARSVLMVAIALLLVMVLLPAILEVQAASR
jgi:cell division protein FtsX